MRANFLGPDRHRIPLVVLWKGLKSRTRADFGNRRYEHAVINKNDTLEESGYRFCGGGRIEFFLGDVPIHERHSNAGEENPASGVYKNGIGRLLSSPLGGSGGLVTGRRVSDQPEGMVLRGEGYCLVPGLTCRLIAAAGSAMDSPWAFRATAGRAIIPMCSALS